MQKSVLHLIFYCRKCRPGVRSAAGIEAVVQIDLLLCSDMWKCHKSKYISLSHSSPAEIIGKCVIMQSEQFELLTWLRAPDFKCVGHLFYIVGFQFLCYKEISASLTWCLEAAESC